MSILQGLISKKTRLDNEANNGSLSDDAWATNRAESAKLALEIKELSFKPAEGTIEYRSGTLQKFIDGEWMPYSGKSSKPAGPVVPKPAVAPAEADAPANTPSTRKPKSAPKTVPKGGAVDANNDDNGKSEDSASRTKTKTRARANDTWAPTRSNAPVAGDTNSSDAKQDTEAQKNANVTPLTVNVDTSTLAGIAAASARGVLAPGSNVPAGLSPADLVTARATLAAKAFIDNGFAKEDVDKAIKGMTIDQLNEAIDSSFAPAAGAFGNDKKGNAYGAHDVKSVVIAPNNRSEFGQTQTGVKTPDGINSWASQGLLKAEMDVKDFEKAGMYTNDANGQMGAIASGIVKDITASTNRIPLDSQLNADNKNANGVERLRGLVNYDINRNSIDLKYDSATNSTLVVDRPDTIANNYTGNAFRSGQPTLAARFDRPIERNENGTINSEQFYKPGGGYDWNASNAAKAADIKGGGTGALDFVSNGHGGDIDDTVANNIPVPVITQAAGGGYTAEPMQITNTTQAAVDKYIAAANPNGGNSSVEAGKQEYEARSAMMTQIAESDPAGFGGMMSGIP